MHSAVSHDPKSFVTDFEDTAPYPTAAPIMRRSELEMGICRQNYRQKSAKLIN